MRLTRTNKNTTTANATVLATTVINNSYSICGKRIASVPVALMAIDDSYQRVLGTTIKKLMNGWDNNKCDFLIVSYRDNKFYVIDGQHRYSVAKAKGIDVLPCIIFEGLTQHDEALKFAQQQDNVNKLNPYDTFKANIACGDTNVPQIAIDVNIKCVCDKYNIQVKKYGNHMGDQKVLRCLDLARYLVRKDAKSFEWTIDVINASNWANCPLAYSKNIIQTISAFYKENIDNLALAEQTIISMMNSIAPDELETMARYEYPEYKINPALSLCVRDLTQGK